jgi:hypothetical protein
MSTPSQRRDRKKKRHRGDKPAGHKLRGGRTGAVGSKNIAGGLHEARKRRRAAERKARIKNQDKEVSRG